MISSFKLGNINFSVSEAEVVEDDVYGIYYYSTKEIVVKSKHKGRIIPEDAKEQTLYHEVVHAVLDELGYHELSSDEKLVQGLSLLLHQFEKTKE